MALYVLFENKNTFLFLYFICLLINLQMSQIILPDPVHEREREREIFEIHGWYIQRYCKVTFINVQIFFTKEPEQQS